MQLAHSLLARRAAVLAGLAVLAPSWTQASPVAGDAVEAQVVRLLHSVRTATPPPLDEVASELSELASGELPFLFTVLERERVPAQDEEPEQVLSRAQRALVLAALERLEEDLARPWALDRLAAGDEPRARAAALWMLSAVGRAGDLGLVLERAMLPEEEALEPRVEAALRAALAAIAGRDPETCTQIERRWRALPDPLVRTMLLAIADARRGDAMPLFADVLGARPDLVSIALAQIRRLGPPTTVEDGRRLARVVRPYLDARQPVLCQAAIQALVELEDFESIPYMIELVLHEEGVLRDVATWGLRRVTGLELAPVGEVWSSWYQGELAWYENDWPRLRARLHSLQIDRISSAVQELTQHGLFRDELSLELARTLANPDPVVRTLVCIALGELQSPASVPWLLDAIGDRRAEVSAAAGTALQRITGIQPPIVPSLWGERLMTSGYEL